MLSHVILQRPKRRHKDKSDNIPDESGASDGNENVENRRPTEEQHGTLKDMNKIGELVSMNVSVSFLLLHNADNLLITFYIVT